jgi:hypothetical protein
MECNGCHCVLLVTTATGVPAFYFRTCDAA